MDLAESLKLERIQIGTNATDKFDVLHEIARLAKRSPVLEEYTEDVIYEALDGRERIGSTGFGRRIAIPHCSFDEVDSFVVGVLIAPNGVDFDSLDGEKTRVLFFIIGPQPQRNKHIQILSTVSKLLESDELVDRLIAADTPETVQKILGGPLSVLEVEQTAKQKSMFHVCVQREELFSEVLQLFASVNESSLAVIETRNASSYLHSLPLFTAFWSESGERPGRVIIAYVDKAVSNDIIRRIHMIAGDIEDEPGLMVAVQDLTYFAGSLDF